MFLQEAERQFHINERANSIVKWRGPKDIFIRVKDHDAKKVIPHNYVSEQTVQENLLTLSRLCWRTLTRVQGNSGEHKELWTQRVQTEGGHFCRLENTKTIIQAIGVLMEMRQRQTCSKLILKQFFLIREIKSWNNNLTESNSWNLDVVSTFNQVMKWIIYSLSNVIFFFFDFPEPEGQQRVGNFR